MNLGCLKFKDVEAEGTIIVKNTMWDGKALWDTLPLSGLPDYYRTLDPKQMRSGEAGLYAQPYISYYGGLLYLPWLDVEHPHKHHNSIQANIDTAQKLYYVLDARGLTKDLVVGLSGKGFRFIWPWVVPFEYTDAFLEMVKDKARFPGIDPSPQTGTNKFLRMAAYRGNKKQGNPTSHVHVHYLEHAAEILSLSELKYRRNVHGKPDVERYLADIERILPRAMAPPEAIQIFEEYVFKLKIRSTIALPGKPRIGHARGVNRERIMSYLEERGITATRYEYGTTEIHKLDTCPSCGKKEGNPYVTSGGALKCFRANKCEAGQDEKGLPAHKWVEGYTHPAREEHDIEVPGLELSEARAILPPAMQTTENITVSASPGVGKTHAALEHFVSLAKDKLVLYTAPTHNLGREVYQKVKTMDTGIETRYIEGRSEDNCRNLKAVNDAASRGYYPARTVCLACGSKEKCLYYEQFKDLPQTGMVFSAHATARFLETRIAPDVWIIDESPLMDFFEETEVSQEEMDKFMQTEPGDVQPLFKEIKRICMAAAEELKDYEIAKFFVKDVVPGNWENATPLEEITRVIGKYFEVDLYPCNSSRKYTTIDNPVVWENSNFKKGMDMRCIKWWDWVVEQDPERVQYIKVEKTKGKTKITYNSVILAPPKFQDCQIVHLDGTVYEPEILEIFPGSMEMIDAQAHLNTCRKAHIMISRGKGKTRTLKEREKKEDLEMLIGHLRPQDKKVLLITYKEQEDFILSTAEQLRPDLTFGSIHFWGPRGINAYENFDACLVYGTPTISPAGTEDKAAALFAEQADMDKWKAGMGRRDITQAIHRIRPVNGDKNIVVMGSYWPTEYLGHPNETIDRMRKGSNMMEAKKRLTTFAREYGFLDKPVANMLGIGTKADKKAIEAWQERLSSDQGGQPDFMSILINNIIRVGMKSQVPPPAIYFTKTGQWNKLLTQIQAELGLPLMGTYKAPGRSAPSRVLGTVEKLKSFYDAIGAVLDMDLYKLYDR